MTILPRVTIPDDFVRNVRINPDIENETKTYFNVYLYVFYFQSSAGSAKKSNDFFGLIFYFYHNLVIDFQLKALN